MTQTVKIWRSYTNGRFNGFFENDPIEETIKAIAYYAVMFIENEGLEDDWDLYFPTAEKAFLADYELRMAGALSDTDFEQLEVTMPDDWTIADLESFDDDFNEEDGVVTKVVRDVSSSFVSGLNLSSPDFEALYIEALEEHKGEVKDFLNEYTKD
jgi:hypothetical protein